MTFFWINWVSPNYKDKCLYKGEEKTWTYRISYEDGDWDHRGVATVKESQGMLSVHRHWSKWGWILPQCFQRDWGPANTLSLEDKFVELGENVVLGHLVEVICYRNPEDDWFCSTFSKLSVLFMGVCLLLLILELVWWDVKNSAEILLVIPLNLC